MKHILSCWLVSSSAFGIATEAPPQTLEIMVEDAAPPWSKPDGTGFANEVVVAAYSEMGVKANLHVVPYARCKKTVLSGKIPACLSMTWDDSFKDLIKLSNQPLIFLHADIFENIRRPLPKPDKHCRLPSNTILGSVRAYEYPPETLALSQQGVRFETFHSDEFSLKSLASERIDAAVVITNDLEPRNHKAVLSATENKVRFAFNCGSETGSIGFSVKHPLGLTAFELFEQGYKLIKDNGKLKFIVDRWTKRQS